MHALVVTLTLTLLLSLAPAWGQRHDIPQEDLGLYIATHYGAGSCSAATLNAAIAALGSTQATLVIPPVPRNSITPCTWTLNTEVTIPSTLRLSIPRGVVLTPGPEVTIKFYAPPDVTGPYQIFNANGTTTGSIQFETPGVVHAEWWGAKGDGVTDSAVAITRALNSGKLTANENTPGMAMTVQLQGGVFLLGSAITPPINGFVGWTLQGMGQLGTILRRTTGFIGTMILIGNNEEATRITRLKQFTVDCLDRPVGSTGIRLAQAPWAIIEDVNVKRCQYGIHQSGAISQVYRDVMIDACTICMQLDNSGDKSIVNVKLDGVHARQCYEVALNIDGSFSMEKVREINVYSFLTDRAVPGGGNTCIRIKSAERLRFYGTHLEQCDPFLQVRDSRVPAGCAPLSNTPPKCEAKITTNILFYGAAFGDLNDVPNEATGSSHVAIDWLTVEEGNGEGSVLEGIRIKEGTSSFTSDYIIALRNLSFPNEGMPTGSGYVLRTNTDLLDDQYIRNQEMDSWTIFRADKIKPTHNTRLQRRFATEDTNDLNTVSIITVGSAPNSTTAFDAMVVGKRTNNADQATYRVHCLFSTNADASVTTLLSSTITPLESAGAAAWDVTCSGFDGPAGCAVQQLQVDQNATGFTSRWTVAVDILQVLQEEPGAGAPVCSPP